MDSRRRGNDSRTPVSDPYSVLFINEPIDPTASDGMIDSLITYEDQVF